MATRPTWNTKVLNSINRMMIRLNRMAMSWILLERSRQKEREREWRICDQQKGGRQEQKDCSLCTVLFQIIPASLMTQYRQVYYSQLRIVFPPRAKDNAWQLNQ